MEGVVGVTVTNTLNFATTFYLNIRCRKETTRPAERLHNNVV